MTRPRGATRWALLGAGPSCEVAGAQIAPWSLAVLNGESPARALSCDDRKLGRTPRASPSLVP